MRKPFLPTLLLLAAVIPVLGQGAESPVPATAPAKTPTTRAEILAVMERMADAQLAQPAYGDKAPADWIAGAFYTGYARLLHVTKNPKYQQEALRIANANNWEFKGRDAMALGHADNETVGQLYIDLAIMTNDVSKLDNIKKQWDGVIAGFANPTDAARRGWNNDPNRDGGTYPWWWCDALYMAPPGMARLSQITWDRRYLDAADKQYWVTYNRLYDKEEKLFYRDSKYLTRRTPNDKKVFWGRGNGWVFAGLANMLPYVPQDYPTRAKYDTLFREMADKLATLQQPDGLWRGSLIDPASAPLPETSGSAFFCYGMAWGVNNGLLERSKYEPVIEKAWAKLNECIRPDGLMGRVQAVGEQPGSTSATSTQAYAVGGFLLAGCEIIKLHENK